MIESLYIAETGMASQQKLIDVISNNIANASTPGFKKTQLNFVDLVYKGHSSSQLDDAGINQSTNNGAGVQALTNSKDFSVGELKQTGNPFDIAIQGAGFIEVLQENGDSAYTRAGRLRLDADGYLVTAQGNRLSTNIQLPPDSTELKIATNGVVSVRIGDETIATELGTIELVRFSNDEGLATIGNNLYLNTESSGDALYGNPGEFGLGQILQGITEVSNVSMTEEMVNLMLAQRGYQLNARIIQVSDQLLDTINNLRR